MPAGWPHIAAGWGQGRLASLTRFLLGLVALSSLADLGYKLIRPQFFFHSYELLLFLKVTCGRQSQDNTWCVPMPWPLSAHEHVSPVGRRGCWENLLKTQPLESWNYDACLFFLSPIFPMNLTTTAHCTICYSFTCKRWNTDMCKRWTTLYMRWNTQWSSQWNQWMSWSLQAKPEGNKAITST